VIDSSEVNDYSGELETLRHLPPWVEWRTIPQGECQQVFRDLLTLPSDLDAFAWLAAERRDVVLRTALWRSLLHFYTTVSGMKRAMSSGSVAVISQREAIASADEMLLLMLAELDRTHELPAFAYLEEVVGRLRRAYSSGIPFYHKPPKESVQVLQDVVRLPPGTDISSWLRANRPRELAQIFLSYVSHTAIVPIRNIELGKSTRSKPLKTDSIADGIRINVTRIDLKEMGFTLFVRIKAPLNHFRFPGAKSKLLFLKWAGVHRASDEAGHRYLIRSGESAGESVRGVWMQESTLVGWPKVMTQTRWLTLDLTSSYLLASVIEGEKVAFLSSIPTSLPPIEISLAP